MYFFWGDSLNSCIFTFSLIWLYTKTTAWQGLTYTVNIVNTEECFLQFVDIWGSHIQLEQVKIMKINSCPEIVNKSWPTMYATPSTLSVYPKSVTGSSPL